ncbi:ferredoxin [Streptomyces sp. yr375]|uniref:ferredoxin n=1 Tax=Streptomyces sp. yr375 TaxID=1761906 RepID=UPI00210A89CF|nr:ferredoxin [Streptomyces sp. yr375]
MTGRIVIDYDRCCGSGMCALSAPGVFDQRDDDGTVVLLTQFPPPGQESTVRTAVENCPCTAIRMENSDAKLNGLG